MRHRFTAARADAGGFAGGRHEGTATDAEGALVFAPDDALPHATFVDPHDPAARPRDIEIAVWTGPVVELGFAAATAVPSWNAEAGSGCWIEPGLRVRRAGGDWSAWRTLARWAPGTAPDDLRRASLGAQADADGAVDTDTFRAAEGREFDAFQLRVRLVRPARPSSSAAGAYRDAAPRPSSSAAGAYRDAAPRPSSSAAGAYRDAAPRLDTPAAPPTRRPDAVRLALLGAVAAERPDPAAPPSAPGGTAIDLEVPGFAQYPHRGAYPEYGGGGEAWCSPSSVAMVRAWWGRSPDDAELAGIRAPNGDPQVPYTAIRAYDHAYRGTGNWSFSAAAAAGDGLEAVVDRFDGVAEAERMLAEGVPLIASVSFTREQLPEAGYATAGHLLVVRGVTEAGDVIVNDPASESNAGVRRVYTRAAFEAAWRRGSGGVAYVVRPTASVAGAVTARAAG